MVNWINTAWCSNRVYKGSQISRNRQVRCVHAIHFMPWWLVFMDKLHLVLQIFVPNRRFSGVRRDVFLNGVSWCMWTFGELFIFSFQRFQRTHITNINITVFHFSPTMITWGNSTTWDHHHHGKEWFVSCWIHFFSIKYGFFCSPLEEPRKLDLRSTLPFY